MDKRIEVKTREGKVIIDVEGQDSMMVVGPDLAVQIGKSLIDAGVSLGIEVSIQAPPKTISALLRQSMVVRARNIIRSTLGKPPMVTASHVVDTVLNMLP